MTEEIHLPEISIQGIAEQLNTYLDNVDRGIETTTYFEEQSSTDHHHLLNLLQPSELNAVHFELPAGPSAKKNLKSNDTKKTKKKKKKKTQDSGPSLLWTIQQKMEKRKSDLALDGAYALAIANSDYLEPDTEPLRRRAKPTKAPNHKKGKSCSDNSSGRSGKQPLKPAPLKLMSSIPNDAGYGRRLAKKGTEVPRVPFICNPYALMAMMPMNTFKKPIPKIPKTNSRTYNCIRCGQQKFKHDCKLPATVRSIGTTIMDTGTSGSDRCGRFTVLKARARSIQEK